MKPFKPVVSKMKPLKPVVFVDDKSVQYPTYEAIKKNIKKLIDESDSKLVLVYRSKRGCFGQWFEHWKLNYENQPRIIKQGWM